MRPVNRGPIPQDNAGKAKVYSEYGNARRDLIERLGDYCSYCEMKVDSSLAVEHIQPKAHHPHLKREWTNFLLACSNCNCTKGDRHPDLADILWPHCDNTFRAFEYGEEGIVKPSPGLSPCLMAKAEASIALTGLNKKPDTQKASDRRWQNRRETWNIAIESLHDLTDCDCEQMRNQIIRTVKGIGYWSIWMTLFALS